MTMDDCTNIHGHFLDFWQFKKLMFFFGILVFSQAKTVTKTTKLLKPKGENNVFFFTWP